MHLSVNKMATAVFISISLFLGGLANAGALIFKNESRYNISINGCIKDKYHLHGVEEVGKPEKLYYYFNQSGQAKYMFRASSRSESCTARIFKTTSDNKTSEAHYIAQIDLSWLSPTGHYELPLENPRINTMYKDADRAFDIQHSVNRGKREITITVKNKN